MLRSTFPKAPTAHSNARPTVQAKAKAKLTFLLGERVDDLRGFVAPSIALQGFDFVERARNGHGGDVGQTQRQLRTSLFAQQSHVPVIHE